MIRLRDMKQDNGTEAEGTPPTPPASPSTNRPRKPRGVSVPPAPTGDTIFYNPAQVAQMWGISHDKVLEFIRTGELDAFNVASKSSRRPQFKIPAAALQAFQEQRPGRDPARSLPPRPPRASQKSSQPKTREYF
jgi:hypothetical protein